MTINFIIESAPTPQPRTSFPYEFGQLVIGRGDDADWQLDDPERYLSRRHCIVTMENGQLTATDASRGGTFVDGSETPLGTGNSIALEDGMRLRMGDFVFRVDMAAATKSAATAAPAVVSSGPLSFDPPPAEPAPAPPPRPDDLPDPFDPYDRANSMAAAPKDTPAPAPKPFGMDDPFALDLPRQSEPAPKATASGGYFDAPLTTPTVADPVPETEVPQDVETKAPPPSPHRAAPASDSAVLAALLSGMGLQPDAAQGDAVDQAQQIGRQYRMLVDGVMQLLRARASAKQQVRAAQTLISSADVNPLKFMVTTDDALDTMLSGDRPGYMPADEAIIGAYRDLADHQIRTWRALQSALRRMIDQFDPEQIEAEIAETGVLGSLLAGGKNALLWQTYEEKYKDIARAAEDRFLGEVGDNFRDAYEGHDKETSR